MEGEGFLGKGAYMLGRGMKMRAFTFGSLYHRKVKLEYTMALWGFVWWASGLIEHVRY